MTIGKTLGPALLAVALAGCAAVDRGLDDYDRAAAIPVGEARSAADTTDAIDPALWVTRDDDTTIYLFGTFHLLPEDYEWRTPTIDSAIAASDTLVVETIIDRDEPEALGLLMARMGMAQDLPPIVQRVAPAKRPLLRQKIARSGLPESAFDLMESWAAGLTLFGLTATQLGLTAEAGVETDLRAAFALQGKAIEQLETNEQQLTYFDTLSLEAQRDFLESVIVSDEQTKAAFGAMLAAWTRGDTDAIAATFNEGMPMGTEIRSAILTRRNRDWADWIAARLDTPGTVFVAVGAGHLAGGDSLLLMLEAAGHPVTRLDE
ncbi:TraB/GumN family protein [Sphingomicrobium astaxanthinifaciens]|uniref:TraB/GumN family protein n=1 Tax=Sphingomicrobium astaxanthinifaciens TaxID=1227949 RepID=UPI001FCBED40|nr:TraB/GumN family protein [Sphingomicrobium astaxanthinifaciens]MCJ7422058.1 TraB/GumN family protein [Sphingomicrobium astaxanthinifaciens]